MLHQYWLLAVLQINAKVFCKSVPVRKVKLHMGLVITICRWFAVQYLLLELMAKFCVSASVCCISFTMTCLSSLGTLLSP